jgi:hypothetical protein
MALTTTTLSAACGQTDVSIAVTSATSFVAGMFVKVDDEVMQIAKNYVSGTTIPVQRGLDGSKQTTHVSSTNVTIFLASDETPSAQTVVQFPTAGTPRRKLYYAAAGAITLPNAGEDMVAIIIGTSTLAMTLADPTKDMDGSFLYIISNGKGAHTVTYTGGVGAGGTTMDVGTYNTTEQTGCALMAANGKWVLWANGIGSSGTQVAGVVWA